MSRARESGATLVDVAVSTVVLVLFLGGVFALLGTSIGSARVTSDRSQLDAKASRVMRRMVTELQDAGSAALVPGTGPVGTYSTFVEFQRPTGFPGGVATWGSTTRYEFRRDPNDPDDGVDNDGNGLVDECQVIRRANVGTAEERVEVLITDLAELQQGELDNDLDDNGDGLEDEPGFVVENHGEGLTLRLTLQHLGRGGHVLSRSLESTVVPRN